MCTKWLMIVVGGLMGLRKFSQREGFSVFIVFEREELDWGMITAGKR
jgi:hypothetical protein